MKPFSESFPMYKHTATFVFCMHALRLDFNFNALYFKTSWTGDGTLWLNTLFMRGQASTLPYHRMGVEPIPA